MFFSKPCSGLICVLVCAAVIGGSPAASYGFSVDNNNTVPGVVANKYLVDGGGADWLTAALLLNLSAGSVYNDPLFNGNLPQENSWGSLPDLEFDTWVGVPGDGTNSILGSAADLGDAPGPPIFTGQKVSASWFNNDPSNTGLTRIANISLTDDAMGTFTTRVSFSGFPNAQVINEYGFIINGEIYFHIDGDLDNNGFVGLSDLDLILNNWNLNIPAANPIADANNDGFVGLDDLDIVLNNWNAGFPPASGTNVPEPASLMLLGVGAAAAMRRARR